RPVRLAGRAGGAAHQLSRQRHRDRRPFRRRERARRRREHAPDTAVRGLTRDMPQTRKTRPDAQPQTTAQQLGSLIKSARDVMRKDKGLSTDIDRLPLLTWVMFLKF